MWSSHWYLNNEIRDTRSQHRVSILCKFCILGQMYIICTSFIYDTTRKFWDWSLSWTVKSSTSRRVLFAQFLYVWIVWPWTGKRTSRTPKRSTPPVILGMTAKGQGPRPGRFFIQFSRPCLGGDSSRPSHPVYDQCGPGDPRMESKD